MPRETGAARTYRSHARPAIPDGEPEIEYEFVEATEDDLERLIAALASIMPPLSEDPILQP